MFFAVRRSSNFFHRHRTEEDGAFPMTVTELPESPSITTMEDVQRDLGTLRNDVSRLSKELVQYLAANSRKSVRDANQWLDGAVRERPLTSVMVAMGFGLLFSIVWRR
jgi:hypothetical protein